MFQVKKLLKYTQPPQIKCPSKPLIEYKNESNKIYGNVLTFYLYIYQKADNGKIFKIPENTLINKNIKK